MEVPWSVAESHGEDLRELIGIRERRRRQPYGKAAVFQTTIPVTPITNLNLSYDFGRRLRLSIGATNLFDRKPPRLNGNLLAHYNSFAYGDNQGVQAYPSFSPFGINGGFYYARALFTF